MSSQTKQTANTDRASTPPAELVAVDNAERRKQLQDEIDGIIDEIDAALDEWTDAEAQLFVSGYRQPGGE